MCEPKGFYKNCTRCANAFAEYCTKCQQWNTISLCFVSFCFTFSCGHIYVTFNISVCLRIRTEGLAFSLAFNFQNVHFCLWQSNRFIFFSCAINFRYKTNWRNNFKTTRCQLHHRVSCFNGKQIVVCSSDCSHRRHWIGQFDGFRCDKWVEKSWFVYFVVLFFLCRHSKTVIVKK